MGVKKPGNKADLGTSQENTFFIVDTGTRNWLKANILET